MATKTKVTGYTVPKAKVQAGTIPKKNTVSGTGPLPINRQTMLQNVVKKTKEAINSPQKPINTSYYDKAFSEYEEKMKADAEIAKEQTQQQYDEQLRQAYVSNIQNQTALSDKLNEAGIRGGGSETSNLKLMTGYQNTRNKTNSERQSALTTIDKNTNDSIFNFKMTNDQAKNAYVQQVQAEMRQIAENKRQEAVEQKRLNQQYAHEKDMWNLQQKASAKDKNKEEKKQYYEARYSVFSEKSLRNVIKNSKDPIRRAAASSELAKRKEQKKTETEAKKLKKEEKNEKYWVAKYSTYFNVDSLRKARKKAKTSAEIAVINARIGQLKTEKRNKNK